MHLVFFFIILVDHPYLRIVSSLLFTTHQLTYLYCGLKDPGIIFPCLEIELGDTGYCYKCGASRGGVHCSYCDVCIEQHDHHCGFIGKCVGKKNLSSFYALLIVSFCNIAIVAGTLGWRTWSLQQEEKISKM